MEKIDEIIKLIREEMMVANSASQSGGFSDKASPEGPVAGYSSPMTPFPMRANGKFDARNPFIKKYKSLLKSLGMV